MSVNSSVLAPDVYTSNGIATEYNFTFTTESADNITVTLHDTETGTYTELVIGVDFTVALNDFGTGTITLDSPADADLEIIVSRSTPAYQLSNYPEKGPFPSATVESNLDVLTYIVQELKYKLDRALVLPERTAADSDLPEADAEKYLRWNVAGDAIEYVPGTEGAGTLSASSNGVLVYAGSDELTSRTITGTANEITVSDGDGQSGNPTISLPSSITLTGKTITGGTYDSPSFSTAAILAPYGISVGNTSELRMLELAANGSNYTGFKAPDLLSGNVIYTMPSVDGTSGQVLATDGSKTLSWTTNGGSGTTSISNGGTGTTTGAMTIAQGADRVHEIADNTTGAGDSFTLGAGDALTGGTNLNGGNVVLEAGDSTGTGTSSVIIKAAKTGSSGTATNTAQTIATFSANALSISPYGTSAGETGEVRFLELAANGSNYVSLKSPSIITSDVVYTLPGTTPSSSAGSLAATSAGVMSWINPIRLSGVTNLSSTATLDTTLANYSSQMIVLNRVSPATDGSVLWIRAIVSGSPLTGASDYNWTKISTTMTTSSASTASGDDADAQIVLTGAVGNATNENVSGWIVSEKTSDTYVRIRWQLTVSDASTAFTHVVGGGTVLNSGTVTALRLMFSSGNMASGNVYSFNSNTSLTG